MIPAGEARIVFMTAPGAEVARSMVRTLVEEGVVACGNIIPAVESIYRWQGSIEEATETLVILKTSSTQLERLEAYIGDLHPYDVPELLAVQVSEGFAPYLAWIAENMRAMDGAEARQRNDT